MESPRIPGQFTDGDEQTRGARKAGRLGHGHAEQHEADHEPAEGEHIEGYLGQVAVDGVD
jgi:hypothetical protein